MRKEKKIVLEGLEPNEIREMTVSHFPTMLALMKEVIGIGDLDMSKAAEILISHYDELKATLCDCMSISEDKLAEVGGSDLVEILEAWVEVNSGFFEKLKSRFQPGLQ